MIYELSSDLLEAQFGPIDIDVVRDNGKERIIRTVAEKSGQVLEISHVLFCAGVSEKLHAMRRTIAGQSMGKAFQAAQVPFQRHNYAGYKYDLPENFIDQYGSDEAATVLAVKVFAGDEYELFADILETYHPDVTAWDDQLFGSHEPTDEQRERIQVLDRFLATL
jgi:hypothetical protein